MATRARKQPERPGARGKQKTVATRSGPGLTLRALVALGSLAARHPTLIGGSTAFAVIFSFVAANALWYQPGDHPSPILRTRNASNTLGFTATRPDTKDVTTFLIEREGDPGTLPAANPLVSDIQAELARQGFYAGRADGVLGPETVAAIRAFEGERGFVVSGAADEALLTALRAGTTDEAVKTAVAVLPKERPFEEVKDPTAAEGVDPVAAAIMAADADPATTAGVVKAVPSEMVMKIQKGLSNIAYADVTVDGFAGEKTRNAIRHFEKHYRLPVTGEPNEAVLDKLKSIGAL